jgi:hypothetical protein
VIRKLRPMRGVFAMVLLLALLGAGAALAARGDPQKRITPADQARAKAMLLRPADFPGFRVGPATGDSDVYCAALDASDLTLTGEAAGRQFASGAAFAGSSALVYESTADANAAWRRNTSAAGERCGRTLLRTEYAKQGVRLVSLRRIAFPRVAQRSVAYRARFVARTPQGEIPLTMDVVGLMHSRAQATVVAGSLLVTPDRTATSRLARLVAKRMATAMRGA